MTEINQDKVVAQIRERMSDLRAERDGWVDYLTFAASEPEHYIIASAAIDGINAETLALRRELRNIR